MEILAISLSPVILLAMYFYYRDKYEKEPIGLLLKSILIGVIIALPVVIVENLLTSFPLIDVSDSFNKLVHDSFIVAASTEELFKLGAFLFLIWNNKNFDEPFDGIVYSVFISLGFAGLENILYVFNNGTNVGILRAFTAVPAHALFGVSMGYYLSHAKFLRRNKYTYIIIAAIMPILLHGFYDFIILSQNSLLILCFIPYMIFMWMRSFKKMKFLLETSIPNGREFSQD